MWAAKSPCLVSIDGANCRISEPRPYNSVWWSHKFIGPGVVYEISVAIYTCDVVWDRSLVVSKIEWFFEDIRVGSRWQHQVWPRQVYIGLKNLSFEGVPRTSMAN